MARITPAILLIILLAACTSAGGTPSASASYEPNPTMSPAEDGATPSAEPSATPETPTWAGHPADGLAFVRAPDPSTGITQVYVVTEDGSERQLTGISGALGASHPVWSPDGSLLAFGGSKVGGTGIKGMVGIVNADGSGERQLGEGEFMQWSPDGTRISFTEVDDVTAEPVSHYVVDVASGQISDLGEGYHARWLDDDRLLFNMNEFAVDGALTTVTYALTLSTGEREAVAENTTVIPSPDRSMVLLVRDGVVSLASADFADPVEIANGGDPVWSPDGTRFALNYDFDEQANPIYAVVGLEGETVQSGIVGSLPSWSPDGTRIAVEYFHPDGPLVRVVDVATGEVVFEAEGQQPAWRP